MPKKIIIVRHGETNDNVERRFQGWNDTPLNEAGLAQAQQVARRLLNEHVTAIYTSDLIRARVTAEYIARPHKLSIITTESLREHHMGIFQGWQWEQEVDKQKQQLWEAMQQAKSDGNWDWKDHGGESLNQHKTRVSTMLDSLPKLYNNQTIVLVTHGGTINRITEHYGLKKDLNEYVSYGNTSVTILERHKQSYVVTIHNDTSHLTTNDNAIDKIVLQSNDQ